MTAPGTDLVAALAPAAARFEAALRRPADAQRRVLARVLAANADTEVGRRYGFGGLRGVADFQARVPIHRYEDLAPDLERVRQGATGVLTAAPVRALEPTSGSTGANKYIPITDAFLAQVQAAVYPWLHDLCRARPGLARAGWYTAITALGRVVAPAEGGPPIGLADDAAWLGARVARAFAARLVVPSSVAAGDMAACRAATALHLLAARDLGFVSVWSPTFFSLLLDFIDAEADALLATVRRRWPTRGRSLARLFNRDGGLRPSAVWPRLAVVSCWTDGPSAPFAARLAARLPGVVVQGKGLLATEGAVSVPRWGAEGGTLAVTSHFLEFLAADDPGAPPALAHTLVVGRTYVPLLTTAGGLYRYRLPDRVEVVGYTEATPRVVFCGRADGTSDLCGEKLAPERVEAVIEAALEGARPAFALLAPEPGAPPAYVLYVEGVADVAALGAKVERGLAEGAHYAYCRALGQLGPVRAVAVTQGDHRYEAGAVRRGGRAGTLKPTRLEARPGWWSDLVGAT